MTPKPLVSGTERREERRRVTLIAGLVCKDSIVFAADSEESGGVRKSSVEKMRRVPERGFAGVLAHDHKRDTSIIVSGAGNGTLCDYAMQRITERARAAQNHLQAIQIIQDILADIWKNHAPLLPVNEPLETDFRLLIGIRSPDGIGPLLYSTQGATIVRRDKYFSWGSGSVTDYLLDQMYYERMPTEHGIAAALYMLQIAKKYVSGVGGDSHILVLRSDGTVDDKPSWEISEEENIASNFTELSGILLLSLLRTRTATEVNFLNTLKAFK
jgi:20S proteasome alpha/beta subunit